MAIRKYKAGDVLYSQGEAARAAFIILSGEVRLDDGAVVGTGVALGIRSLYKHRPHTETATATTEASVQVVAADELDRLAADSPPEIQKIMMSLMQPPLSGTGGDSRMAEVIEKLVDRMNGKESSDETPAFNPSASRKAFEDMDEVRPIRELLLDENINDILINGAQKVFIERNGKLEQTPVAFASEEAVFKLAEKILALLGRKLDRARPLMDARLQDGSRVNIIAPPLAVDGTSISIRKFPSRRITLDMMRDQKNISHNVCEFLKIVGRCRINTAISGGTGSGKTTLLNAMVDFIDPEERIVTIEDAVELQPQQPDAVRLETRRSNAGVKHADEVNMRDLVRNALRMRPDRIIVGEVRGEEAFDMLQAMNTGHEGSLTTIHANHPRDALSRLENMVAMGNINLPMKSLRYQIASALHVIVQISRMRDGQRRVTQISEIVGMEGDVVTMHDLFNFVVEKEGKDGKITGSFKWSGIMPRFLRRIAYYGELPRLEEALGVSLSKQMQ